MSLVFKKTKSLSHLLITLGLIFFSFKAMAEQPVADMNTISLFHESESRAEVLTNFELKDKMQELLL